MQAAEIFRDIERLMLLLSPLAGNNRYRLIAYQAMVKGVRMFKEIVKKQDFTEWQTENRS